MNQRDNLKRIVARLKSELTDRKRFERAMERRLGAVWKEQRDELMRLLGDPPLLSNVPESYWNNGGKAIRRAVESVMEDIYMAQSMALVDQVRLTVDWVLVNQRAVDWAARNATVMMENVQQTTRNSIIDYVQKYYQNDWTIDDLTERIARIYAPERARTVAITETTNAAVQSQIETARQLQQDYGVRFKEVWRVSEYDRVCELCEPKEGKPTSEVGYPPEHINCACYVEYEMVEE